MQRERKPPAVQHAATSTLMSDSGALSSFMKHVRNTARLLTRHLPACYTNIREDANSRLTEQFIWLLH